MSVRRAATPLRPGLTSRPASHWVLAVLMIGLVGLFCTSSGMQQLGAAWGPLLRQPAPLRFDHFTVAQWQQPALRLAPAGSKQYFDAGSSQYKEEALGNLTAHRWARAPCLPRLAARRAAPPWRGARRCIAPTAAFLAPRVRGSSSAAGFTRTMPSQSWSAA
jgi:hypothetical protein